ncbi:MULTISPECIES: hypothetical protein [unclassified Stenotrophomonas]|uniref:hypothetical protein n=1 Tax=unclassified Stenotrophomonas TaxID=196198 RepID=UPI0021195592|nr:MULTISPECIES: hypothetical protein [unclassified Stenotrophomonas]
MQLPLQLQGALLCFAARHFASRRGWIRIDRRPSFIIWWGHDLRMMRCLIAGILLRNRFVSQSTNDRVSTSGGGMTHEQHPASPLRHFMTAIGSHPDRLLAVFQHPVVAWQTNNIPRHHDDSA